MAKSILLQKGTVLTHDEDEHVVPLYDTDVLICGNVITAVGKDLHATLYGQADIFDCRGKIISPGYIDTHHHLWQTQLKGRHADEGLVAYMVTGKPLPHRHDKDIGADIALDRQHDVICIRTYRHLLGSAFRLS
jgi:cytosine/adenosine deaminase-related metal-dependent hydrolase